MSAIDFHLIFYHKNALRVLGVVDDVFMVPLTVNIGWGATKAIYLISVPLFGFLFTICGVKCREANDFASLYTIIVTTRLLYSL